MRDGWVARPQAASGARGARAAALRGAAVEVGLGRAPTSRSTRSALVEDRPRAHRAPAATWLGDCRPVQRGLVIGDVEAAGTPILLVHGMVDNRSIFTLLRRGLRRRGFGRVSA